MKVLWMHLSNNKVLIFIFYLLFAGIQNAQVFRAFFDLVMVFTAAMKAKCRSDCDASPKDLFWRATLMP